MNPTNKLRNIVRTNTYSDLEDRLAYNEDIQVVPEYFKDITLIGVKGVLTKMYKFTEHTTTRGGLVTQKYKNYIKDSGKAGASLDDFLYQARGIIVSVSPEAKKFINDTFAEETAKKIVPGTTIWISPSSGVSPNNQFLYDREHPVVEQIDYLVIHPNHIDAIEESTPVKPIEYSDAYVVEEVNNYELPEQDS
jgi:hypothetical protein